MALYGMSSRVTGKQLRRAYFCRPIMKALSSLRHHETAVYVCGTCLLKVGLVWISVCVIVCMHTHACVCVCVHMHVCVCVCVCVHVCVCVCVCVLLNAWLYACIHMCVCVCMYIDVCACSVDYICVFILPILCLLLSTSFLILGDCVSDCLCECNLEGSGPLTSMIAYRDGR